MNLTKTTTVILSPGEIVQALKKVHPNDIVIQALPSNGGGVYMALQAAGKALSLSYERRASSADDVVEFGKKLKEVESE